MAIKSLGKKLPTKKAPAKKASAKKEKLFELKLPKASEEFLYKYLNNASPVSYEASGQKIWLDYLKPYIDEHMVDVYGTAVGVVNPGQKYKVVIEAHADEIAWYVNYIADDGYIFISRNGGSDTMIAPSMRVNLHTKKGPVTGIFGWPAIHVREPGKEEIPTLKNIFLDVGAKNKQEVLDMGIHVGTVATFVDGLMELNKQFLVGRALDNRIGGFVIAEAVRRLRAEKFKPNYTLYIVNAVQEEIGLRGAEMIARRLQPNVAIVTDVTHDTHSPAYNKRFQGDIACGKGPTLTYGPAVQNNVQEMLIAAAKKADIPLQFQPASRSTGTDTDSFAYAGEGFASALISMPLKYMHTTVETMHKSDIEAAIQLYMAALKSIKGTEDWRYFK